MDIRLDGRVALVTGASRGIGKATAAALAASGAHVMLSSRKADALEAAVSEIAATNAAVEGAGELAFFAANAGETDQADACVAATLDRFGALDILVNNAATNAYMGPTLGISDSQFDKTIQVNQRGPLVWTRAAWTAAMEDNGGVVLNVASIGGMSAGETIGVYNGTKAALLHLTRQLAGELSPTVRVNAIAPGLVKTDMARALWEPNEASMARYVPMKRLGEPEDIADAAVFLCSDVASWITGATLVVDGGMLLR
jgi:NAD(P)-dependent dehydrogenase (short-subunit alcohol dehydrogenase family)